VPVTAEAGANVSADEPGGTTTEAIYEDETKPIDDDTTHVPTVLVGVEPV